MINKIITMNLINKIWVKTSNIDEKDEKSDNRNIKSMVDWKKKP